jgi:hypothetical protein
MQESMPSAKQIDLEELQGVEIVLVPLDDGAAGHRPVLDRHELAQGALGDHEAAHVLGEVARKIDELAGELERAGEDGIVRVEPLLAQRATLRSLAARAPDGLRKRVLDVGREAHDFGDLPQSRLGPVADHRGGEGRVVAAVGLVDPLDDLLAPLVLEIDVDVGRLVALGRDEPLEQQIDARAGSTAVMPST